MLHSTFARLAVLLGALSCGAGGDSDAAADAAPTTPEASTFASDSANAPCGERDCRLDCAPEDTWLAIDAPDTFLGDADPASPDQVGDGNHHLFVGVAHIGQDPGSSCPDPDRAADFEPFIVLLHDSVSNSIDRGYVPSAEPLVSETIVYDRYGMETPSYLRAGNVEYLYYCALYSSYDCRHANDGMVLGKVMALRRVDGGSWERVMQDVAPFSPGSRSQCEPDAAYDPATGLFHLFFIADGSPPGLFMRTSRDPEHFPAPPEGQERHIVPLAARPGVAFDPFDRVWRFSFDAYDGSEAVQSWAESLDALTSDEILAHNAVLHSSEHDLHLDVHLEGSPNVLQSVTPQFPNPDEVLFFYTGIGTSGYYRVFGQRCTRR